MHDSVRLTAMDTAIISCLQVNPRASWAVVGTALGIDPVTAARRWKNLSDNGLAWVTAAATSIKSGTGAIVEVSCATGQAQAVAEELAGDPECMTIDINTGGRDLMLTVSSASFRSMSIYLLTRFGRVSGIRSVSSHLRLQLFSDASSWRIGSLTAEQESILGARNSVTATSPTTEADTQIAAYLAEDGRRSSAEISELVDLSEATVRRRISRLQSSGQLTLRCDVARESSGYPIGVWYLCRIPSDKITAAGTALGKLAPVRMCTAVDGSANLIIQAWVQNLEQVSAFESKLCRTVPSMQVLDRSILLHTVKRVGRLIGAQGQAI